MNTILVHRFAKGLHLFFIATLLAGLAIMASSSPVALHPRKAVTSLKEPLIWWPRRWWIFSKRKVFLPPSGTPIYVMVKSLDSA